MAMAVEETVVIIVGAGPSGLATAACLRQLSIPYIILERDDCFASLFKKKSYDRLHLHLAKEFCQLPHMPFPADYPTFVSRNDFLKYLDNYVSRFEINPMYGSCVEHARFDENSKRWKVRVTTSTTSDGFKWYEGRFLVVATGETSDAFIPEVDGLERFKGEIIHSTEYKSGDKYVKKNVLVVGCGNSGMEIALDLANHGARASIVVRSPMHILSRWMIHYGVMLARYIPIHWADSLMVFLSKLRYGDLTKYGIKRPENGGPFLVKARDGKFPVIDLGTCKKIRSREIQVFPALKNIKGESEVVFENGECHPFDAIVFATGFKRTTHLWLEGDDSLLNKDGFANPKKPNHWLGENGLYCAGLAMRGLFGAAMDAQNIANHISNIL